MQGKVRIQVFWVLASRGKKSSNPTIIKLLRKQATQSAKSCSEKEPLLKRRSCGRRGSLNFGTAGIKVVALCQTLKKAGAGEGLIWWDLGLFPPGLEMGRVERKRRKSWQWLKVCTKEKNCKSLETKYLEDDGCTALFTKSKGWSEKAPVWCD